MNKTVAVNEEYFRVVHIMKCATSVLLLEKEQEKKISEIKEALKKIDWNKLIENPVHFLRSLGFTRWDDDTDILLLPVWIWDAVPEGTALYSISGNEYKKGDIINFDTRFGVIAYGIRHPELALHKIKENQPCGK